MQKTDIFNRPVIILSAPRSGSTLLYEQLAKSKDFWTINGESHHVIEGIERFNITGGICDSNKITGDNVDQKSAEKLRDEFYARLINFEGTKLSDSPAYNGSLRFLEKTPKNSLRIGMMEKIFPDALYIYLYRNPKENISSIIDAWNSEQFVTYKGLPGRKSSWSLLLPEGWQSYNDSAIEEVAAFQWKSANDAIIEGLEQIDPARWIALSYSQLVSEPRKVLEKLFAFCRVSGESAKNVGDSLSLSRYTLTKPDKNKWHKNAHLLCKVMPALHDSIDKIKSKITVFSEADFDLSIEPSLCNLRESLPAPVKPPLSMSRNSPCYCNSGLRFKHCHGIVMTRSGSIIATKPGYSKPPIKTASGKIRYTFTVSARSKTEEQSIQQYLQTQFNNLPFEQIDSVFGFVERSTLYGGRIFERRQLSDADINHLGRLGIGLRIPFTNHDVTRQEYEDNRPLIEKYHNSLNSVICTNDDLAAWIKEDYPEYDIEASVIKNIDDLRKLEKALEIYTTVVLPMTANRNNPFLDSIEQKNRIRLFANAGCALTCPAKICYPSISQINKYKGGEFLCSQSLKDREMIGMVDFDLEALCDKGFNKFKLLRSRHGRMTGV